MKITFTTMVMVQNENTQDVLAHDRYKYPKGIIFPGGHVENGESIYDCAVRETKEETGLDVFNLKSCGFMHWSNSITFERYFVFLYKTTEYSGDLLLETSEGCNFWINIDVMEKLPNEKKMKHLDKYLPMFLDDKYSEIFCSWNNDYEAHKIIYK